MVWFDNLLEQPQLVEINGIEINIPPPNKSDRKCGVEF
jgi:hypothetical protein